MKRREFTKADKAAMVRRATRQHTLFCEGCGLDLTGKRIEFDHVIAEALITDKTRPLTPADGQVLGYWCCHRGEDGKTAQDVAAIAEAKRREANHFGIRPTIRGRGFRKASPQRSASRPLSRKADRHV